LPNGEIRPAIVTNLHDAHTVDCTLLNNVETGDYPNNTVLKRISVDDREGKSPAPNKWQPIPEQSLAAAGGSAR
jgi:hypothetical protein